MKKRWNVAGKMMVCAAAAAVMMMMGTAAQAEMIETEEEILTVQEEMLQEEELVPETELMEVLPEEAPAGEEEIQGQESVDEGILEAGEPDIEMMELVEIEENLIPGAAMPELEAEFLGEEEAAEEPKEAVQAGNSETCVSGTLRYEDSDVAVTVVVSEAAQLPADTEVKVRKLEEGSERYEAAKAAASQSVEAGAEASYTFYDVTLESEGQALEVEEGTVSVWMEFKAEGDAQKDVVSIEETESGKVARKVADAAAGKAGSVELAY